MSALVVCKNWKPAYTDHCSAVYCIGVKRLYRLKADKENNHPADYCP